MDQASEHIATYFAHAKQSWDEHGFARIDALSFLLGSATTILFILLEPVIRALIGGVLVSILTLLKYAVCLGGIVVCGVILVSKKPIAGLASKRITDESPEPNAREQFVQRATDDFDIVGYKESHQTLDKQPRKARKTRPTDTTYESFVRQAASR
ncbi:LANO_0H08834g1_1 [Lachancea nothofagi CBS 11611]|uniref:LANO_0H08834g1_1 n=1 Tax=Lachancea nothofagi CBS 11611 TaxID=1266666 RepID=A0A1G4KLT9_9SACH|nr:LANO_0H08834g1_1 [Lachancea nothofagi CBS 11611]